MMQLLRDATGLPGEAGADSGGGFRDADRRAGLPGRRCPACD